jgi:hypothetical protein
MFFFLSFSAFEGDASAFEYGASNGSIIKDAEMEGFRK